MNMKDINQRQRLVQMWYFMYFKLKNASEANIVLIGIKGNQLLQTNIKRTVHMYNLFIAYNAMWHADFVKWYINEFWMEHFKVDKKFDVIFSCSQSDFDFFKCVKVDIIYKFKIKVTYRYMGLRLLWITVEYANKCDY